MCTSLVILSFSIYFNRILDHYVRGISENLGNAMNNRYFTGILRLFFSPRISGLNSQEILDAPEEILLIYPALLS